MIEALSPNPLLPRAALRTGGLGNWHYAPDQDAGGAADATDDASATAADDGATESTADGDGATDAQADADAKVYAELYPDDAPQTSPAPKVSAKPKPAAPQKPATEKPDDDATDADLDAESEVAADVAPVALTTEQAELLKRFKVDPQSKALAAMSPQERTNFLGSLQGHLAYTTRVAQENAAYRRGEQLPAQGQRAPAAQQQTAPPPAAPAADDAWKPLGDYGDGYIEAHRAGARAEAHALVAPIVEQLGQANQRVEQMFALLQDFGRRLRVDDEDAAFESLELPEGVDKGDPKVRQSILDAAMQQIQQDGAFSFEQRSLRKAISRAAESLYTKQKAQADAARRSREQRSRARGSPDRGATRSPTTQPQPTQAQLDELAMAGIDRGLRGDELEAFVTSGGASR